MQNHKDGSESPVSKARAKKSCTQHTLLATKSLCGSEYTCTAFALLLLSLFRVAAECIFRESFACTWHNGIPVARGPKATCHKRHNWLVWCKSKHEADKSSNPSPPKT
mmetsp:Transcript_47892/g.94046  ORF Transcript_47892/g.94046 Transcript_47892/m.94046 type:complete len:108 (+) Transcript_47892:947-1270(+)